MVDGKKNVLHSISIRCVNFLHVWNSLVKSNCFSNFIVSNKHLSLGIPLQKLLVNDRCCKGTLIRENRVLTKKHWNYHINQDIHHSRIVWMQSRNQSWMLCLRKHVIWNNQSTLEHRSTMSIRQKAYQRTHMLVKTTRFIHLPWPWKVIYDYLKVVIVCFSSTGSQKKRIFKVRHNESIKQLSNSIFNSNSPHVTID